MKIQLFLISLFFITMPSLAQDSENLFIKDIIAPYPYPEKYIQLADSIEVAYLDEGQGKQTLLFIHGLASYMTAWEKTLGELSQNYRCVAVDLPGYGRSSKGHYPSTMSFYAEIISSLIHRLKLKNVTLVGHSMGGQIAVTAALKFPEEVDALILLAPAGFETFTEEDRKAITAFYTIESMQKATEDQVRTNYRYNFYKMPASTEALIQERVKMARADDFSLYCQSVVKGVQGMLSEPVFHRLKEVEQKTLVLYGTNDFLIPNKLLHPGLSTTSVGKTGAGEIQDCHLEFIRECGHFMQLEKPKEVLRLIQDFLKQ
ncbi:alpha/beta hydrolase [Rapidithrix thailandica]|uniref:Alpha/beta hydrolase n=1 Tax=Rapidithrix thailandica TaxID=413964 RepID=A0AAW9S714_9BACT